MNKKQFFIDLTRDIESLITGESDWLANLANAAALIYQRLPDLNWSGFYLYKQGELVLGPFQGKPACTRIAVGKGVCGTAVQKKETQVVPNVHEFPGHIACDSASCSEIVVPIIVNDQVVAVLDIDSPAYNTFDFQDKVGFESVVNKLVKLIDWGQVV